MGETIKEEGAGGRIKIFFAVFIRLEKNLGEIKTLYLNIKGCSVETQKRNDTAAS